MIRTRTLLDWYEAGMRDAMEHGHLNCGMPSSVNHTVYFAMRQAGFREGQRRIAVLAKLMQQTPPPPGPRGPNPGTGGERGRPPRQPRTPNPGVPEKRPRVVRARIVGHRRPVPGAADMEGDL